MATPTKPQGSEPLITLCQAASRYPGHRGAGRLHPSTLTRWILRGVRGVGGERIRLEAVRVGCRWLTSEAALERFAAALGGAEEPSTPRTPASRNNAAENAGRELEQLGA